jgi:hypothetical protein
MGGIAVDISELVAESASVALEHATALQRHLQEAGAKGDSALRECDDEVHRLIGDIVSLRNAAELLRRMSPAS